jgi:hypothetical protein
MSIDAECRSCGAPIRWAVSQASGKRIPLDVEPVDDGNIVETGRTHTSGAPMVRYLKKSDRPIFPSLALVVGGEQPVDARYVTHFATCPNADQHRRR